MSVRMKLSGVKELLAQFEHLDAELQSPVVTNALAEAAEPVAERARALAPEKTGKLRRSIQVIRELTKRQRRRVKLDGTTAYVAISPNYSKFEPNYAPHAHLIEFGTGPRTQKKTGRYVGRTPPQPFLRPAFDSGWKIIVRKFGESFSKFIEAAAQRNSK